MGTLSTSVATALQKCQIEVRSRSILQLSVNKYLLPVEQRSATLLKKGNGVKRYHLCHVLRAITFSSDNGSNLDRAITLRHDNGSYVPRAITIRNDNFAVL